MGPEVSQQQSLAQLRMEVDAVNHELLVLLRRRFEVVGRIAEVKRALGVPVADPAREFEMSRALEDAVQAPLDRSLVTRIFACIFQESRAWAESKERPPLAG